MITTLKQKMNVCVCSLVQSCPILCDPMDCSLPVPSVHGIFQARVLEWVAISYSRGSSQLRSQTWVSMSPALAGGVLERRSHSVMSDSLRPHGLYSPWNSPGQNTGVGSLSLLQGIFPTQGLNAGLLHCRQILYQLNHKGSPADSLPLCWPGKPQKMNITLYFDKFFDLKEENYFKNDTIVIMTLNFLKAEPDETIYSLRAKKIVLDFIY